MAQKDAQPANADGAAETQAPTDEVSPAEGAQELDVVGEEQAEANPDEGNSQSAHEGEGPGTNEQSVHDKQEEGAAEANDEDKDEEAAHEEHSKADSKEEQDTEANNAEAAPDLQTQ